MSDAPRNQFPRWGDFPGIANLEFIKSVIRDELFFDRKTINKATVSSLGSGSKDDAVGRKDIVGPTRSSAPEYVIDNKERFSYLLENHYRLEVCKSVVILFWYT